MGWQTPFQRLLVLKIVRVCRESLHHSHEDTVYQNLDYNFASAITSAASLFIRHAYELFSYGFLRVCADYSSNSLSGYDSTYPSFLSCRASVSCLHEQH